MSESITVYFETSTASIEMLDVMFKVGKNSLLLYKGSYKQTMLCQVSLRFTL